MPNPTLTNDDPRDPQSLDWTLAPDAPSVWIAVGDVCVHISRLVSGVRVALYAKGHENDDALNDCYTSFDDAHAAMDDDEIR